jgi:hypothetical protein
LIEGLENIMLSIDELITNLNTIISSKYMKVHRVEIEKLLMEISIGRESVILLFYIQENWIYFEGIFFSPEI